MGAILPRRAALERCSPSGTVRIGAALQL